MKVVLQNNNNYINYNISNIDGYIFKPKKYINNLVIVNEELLKLILIIKINKKINNISKIIDLMTNSNATIISDCEMMENELVILIKMIENKYKIYLDEFEYFDLIKTIYELNMRIDLKKRMIID